jgi:hypothetical protein
LSVESEDPWSCDPLLFQKTNLDMPSKAKSGGQGESAMAGSEEEVVTGGTEVSLPAIALWGEREQLMWGEGTALVLGFVCF